MLNSYKSGFWGIDVLVEKCDGTCSCIWHSAEHTKLIMSHIFLEKWVWGTIGIE